MKSPKAKYILGLLMGLLVPLVGIFIVVLARPELKGIQQFEHEMVKQINVYIITFGMIVNAGLFFIFLRFDKEEISRGILLSSVIFLILIFIYRFLL